MASPPDSGRLEEHEDNPVMQGLLRFLDEQKRNVADIQSWDVIVPDISDAEFSVRFTDGTGYRGTLRELHKDDWHVHTFALTVTLVDHLSGIYSFNVTHTIGEAT